METAPNGRIGSKEVYDLVGRMEERLLARLDRLEDKMTCRVDEVDDQVRAVEARVNRQDGLVGMAGVIGAVVAAWIGWNK